ncbi:MAG TPA: AMP-binding protein [Pseudonocardiaceae bacterium]|nr:AMP-binding protein [Pseudonocardiaceae bacterium]
MCRAGLVDPTRPDEAMRSMLAVRRLGPIAGAAWIAARRYGAATALVDEVGSLTYRELGRRSNALARAWISAGLNADSVVAVLCRDHRHLLDCMLAGAKIGAKVLLLNTGFGSSQLADVVRREQASALAHDQEFTEILTDVDQSIPRFLAWVDDADSALDAPTLAELIARSPDAGLRHPPAPGSVVLLTSGTTGTPKGAARQLRSVFAATHFVERIPFRRGESTFIGTPMFHATGLSQLIIALALGSAVVARRRFDPEQTLRAVQDNRCTGLILVPTMLTRILDLPTETRDRYDVSSLRVILTAGSALPPDVSDRTLDRFGKVLYNLYGSTEVAVATVATPAELADAPGTVGRTPRGCVVRIYDNNGRRINEPDASGRIFVGSELSFGGYTGGDHKEMIDGLLSSGDVGHLDADGLLFVDGRDDDMIVSGGENVFPVEIENLLVARQDVLDAAVIGIADPEFGQRLKAFIVPATEGALDANTVKDYVKANLARYKVPREVVFVDELPHNQTGKLLRGRLAENEAADERDSG